MPKETTTTEVPGHEVGHDIMAEAAARLGLKLPKARTAEQRAAAEDRDNQGRREEDDLPAGAVAETETAAETEEEETERKGEGETQTQDSTATTTDTTPEAKADQEATAQAVAKLKDLAPELRTRVQGILDSRIGQIRAQSSEKIEAAVSKAAELETRVSELSTELEETKSRGGAPVIVPGVHPLFLANTEAEIDGRVEKLEAFEDWADANRDGVEGDGTPENPGYTADQIRARLREIRREKERIVPQARKLLQDRAADEAAVRVAYPQAYDSKSPDYRARLAVMKTLPELRRLPQAHTLALQIVLGEKALAALKAGAGKETTTPPKAPRVPGAGGAAKGAVVTHTRDKPATSAANKTYVKNKSHASLVSAAAAFL